MKIFLALLLLLSHQVQAQGKTCNKYVENCECKTPGISFRWEHAYCMAKLGIGDVDEREAEADQCIKDTQPAGYEKLTDCQKNQFWREKFCELKKTQFKSQAACMKSIKSIPDFIVTGP